MSRFDDLLQDSDFAAAAAEAAVFGSLSRQAFYDELEKIAFSGDRSSLIDVAYPGLTKLAADTPDAGDQTGQMEAQENDEVDRISPVHDLLGVRAEKTKEGAQGIPVLAPPPGHIYDPIVGAMVPKMDDGGWVQRDEALLQRSHAVGKQQQQQQQQGAMEQAVAQQQQAAAQQAAAGAAQGSSGQQQPSVEKPKPKKLETPSAPGIAQPSTPSSIAGSLPR